MKSKLANSAVFGVLFTLVILAIAFYFDWLGGLIGQQQAILYSLLLVVAIGVFQAVVAGFVTRSEREQKLDRQIQEMVKAFETASAFKEMQQAGRIISTSQLMELERQQQEVWVVLEDPSVFQDDPDFFEFDSNSMRNGMKFVFFVSSDFSASVKWFITQLTDIQLKLGDEIPREVKVGKGVAQFVYVDPHAFFFFSPVIVWNPFPKHGQKRQVLLDFPRHPPEYHVIVPQKQANRIVERLDTLYRSQISG